MITKPKTLIFDVDDCIVDFLGFVCLIHNKMHKTAITRNEIIDYPIKDSERTNIHGHLVKDENLYKTFKDLESQGLYAVLPVFPEAKQALIILRELGYKIILLTARDSIYRKQSELNLLLNDIPYDELILSKDKAAIINKLSLQHDILLFADDRLETVVDVSKKCNLKYKIVVNRPHNAYGGDVRKQGIKRVNDLLEVIQLLQK